MRAILEIARLQLMENVRRQVHLITVFMAFVMLALPAYVNTFSMGLQAFELTAKDFGLTLLSYYGVAMALMLGSSVVPLDIERKTIYPLLSRPVARVSYLAGQFLGTAVLLVGSMFLLATALGVGVAGLSHYFDPALYAAALGYSLECTVLVAACLCFSTLASPPLAGVMGFFLYVVGGLSTAFTRFFLREDRGNEWLANIVDGSRDFLPNFEVFRLKYPVVHNIHIIPSYHFYEFVYAMGWVTLFLMLAGIRFEKRDL
ncbi:ABC transporter permease subunit [bacterium]|nr:ABC transporter permease subunit [bacterium]